MDKFVNRHEAGVLLAGLLRQYAHQPNVVILALPRGGVPVAYEIATALSLPLDVFIVRKLGVPGHEELAMGAIASGGTVIFNEAIIRTLNIDPIAIETVLKSEQQVLLHREQLYRGMRDVVPIKGQTIILVDDGIATGASLRVAITALHKLQPARIVIAVPVGAYDVCEKIHPLVDEMVCPLQPMEFHAVGLWYDSFPQTPDDEVTRLLEKAGLSLRL